MTEISSVMDKIRILRSNRRKPKLLQPKPKPVSVTMAPVTMTPVATADPKGPQQWVPFIVLDIGQSKDSPASVEKVVNDSSSKKDDIAMPKTVPLFTTAPVSSSIPVIKNTVSSSVATSNNKTVIKSVTGKRGSSPRKCKSIPVTCTITVTSNSLKNSPAKGKQSKTVSNTSTVTISRPKGTTGNDPVSKHNTLEPKTVPKLNTFTSGNAAVTKHSSKLSGGDRLCKQNTLSSKDALVAKQKVLVSPDTVVPLPMATTESNGTPDNTQLSEKDNVTEHVQSQSDESTNTSELAPVGCVICSELFPTLTEMQAHYLSEHKNRRKRNIDSVNSLTQKSSVLASTLERKDDTDEPELNIDVDETDPKCPVCSIAFKSSLEVKNHVKLVHSYRCSECNDTFYTLFEFTGHKCNKGTKKLKRVRKKPSRNPNWKPEVVKVMKNFVHIQPKVKKKLELPSLAVESQDPVPLRVTNCHTIAADTSSEGSELQTNSAETVLSEAVINPNKPELSATERKTPSPTLTISPLNCKESGGTPIRVLETKNLRCFKFRKDEIADDKTLGVSKTEVIQEKLEQLKKNPQVSISWVPRLRIKNEDDGEFVCGRCNVICDDMEDYMDHIQDCLTITSVTLEPTSNPPQRILRLHKETSSFGFQESNNNRYSINRNLINKLQAVAPQMLTDSKQDQNHTLGNASSSSSSSSDVLYPNYQNELDSNVRSLTKDSLQNPYFCVKEEPVDDITDNISSRTPIPSVDGLKSNTCFTNNSKVTQPMVVIPVDQNSTKNFMINKDAGKVPNPPDSSPDSPAWESSLLIDTDDIKMEVEEEIVDDHFEG